MVRLYVQTAETTLGPTPGARFLASAMRGLPDSVGWNATAAELAATQVRMARPPALAVRRANTLARRLQLVRNAQKTRTREEEART